MVNIESSTIMHVYMYLLKYSFNFFLLLLMCLPTDSSLYVACSAASAVPVVKQICESIVHFVIEA